MTTIYEELKTKLENNRLDKVEVTASQFKQILEDPDATIGPAKPEAPIKRMQSETTETWVKLGMFRAPRLNKVMKSWHEYDNQDPTYLEELKEYKLRERTVNTVYYHGKKVVVVDSEFSI